MNAILAVAGVTALAVTFYKWIPKYPNGHEHVTLKRLVFGAFVRGFFEITVILERLGLVGWSFQKINFKINSSILKFPDSAVVIQNVFKGTLKEPKVLESIDVEFTEIAEVPVAIFKPNQTDGESKARKAIVYFHGGGFVAGSVKSHFNFTQHLTNETGVVVISVEYPLAPQNPFPAAPHACINVTKAVFEMADQLSLDCDSISVAGDSCGGLFAAIVALHFADHETYRIKSQILIAPSLLQSGVSVLPSFVHYHQIFRSKTQ